MLRLSNLRIAKSRAFAIALLAEVAVDRLLEACLGELAANRAGMLLLRHLVVVGARRLVICADNALPGVGNRDRVVRAVVLRLRHQVDTGWSARQPEVAVRRVCKALITEPVPSLPRLADQAPARSEYENVRTQLVDAGDIGAVDCLLAATAILLGGLIHSRTNMKQFIARL